MRGYLLDTNVVIGFAYDPDQFRGDVRTRLLAPSERLVVSVVCAFEMAVKHSLGKLPLPDGFDTESLDVAMPHAARVRHLPFHHRDPFDRLLIAQAIEEDLILVTSDRAFSLYSGLRVLPA